MGVTSDCQGFYLFILVLMNFDDLWEYLAPAGIYSGMSSMWQMDLYVNLAVVFFFIYSYL